MSDLDWTHSLLTTIYGTMPYGILLKPNNFAVIEDGVMLLADVSIPSKAKPKIHGIILL